jgi:hypothetical protein
MLLLMIERMKRIQSSLLMTHVYLNISSSQKYPFQTLSLLEIKGAETREKVPFLRSSTCKITIPKRKVKFL